MTITKDKPTCDTAKLYSDLQDALKTLIRIQRECHPLDLMPKEFCRGFVLSFDAGILPAEFCKEAGLNPTVGATVAVAKDTMLQSATNALLSTYSPSERFLMVLDTLK